jgi:hypothetical protein
MEAGMSEIGADAVRKAVIGLSENGGLISPAMIRGALGLTSDDQRIRWVVRDMVKRGELTRVETGQYRYNPDGKEDARRKADFYPRIWRAIRSAKPGFTLQDIALVTRVSYSHVRKYSNFLIETGFLAKHGKQGNTRKYRATNLARETRETPYPPRRIADPFEREKNAGLAMVRLFLLGDPYQTATREKILSHCRTIQARFEKSESEAEEAP